MAGLDIRNADNRALRRLPGIGKVGARKIEDAVKSGAVIESVGELAAIAGVRRSFLPALAAAVELRPDRTRPEIDTRLPVVRLPELNVVGPAPTWNIFPHEWSLRAAAQGPGTADFAGWTVAWEYDSLRGRRRLTADLDADGEVGLTVRGQDRPASFVPAMSVFVADEIGRIVAERHTTLPNDALLRIRLPETRQDDRLRIAVRKTAADTDSGLTLDWAVTRRLHPRGTAPSESGSVDLSRDSELLVEAHFPAQFDTIRATVRTEYGLILFDGDLAFEALAGDDDVDAGESIDARRLTIEIAPPNEDAFTVRLDEDLRVVANPYLSHKIKASFALLDASSFDMVWRGEERFAIDVDGTARVVLRHHGVIDDLAVEVEAPTGEILGRLDVDAEALRSGTELVVAVPPKELVGSVGGFEQLPVRPDKALCRLLDPSGEKTYADRQVIFYLSQTPNPGESDYSPYLAARSESGGYFTIDLPTGPFTGAFARVGVALDGARFVDVEIRLERDTITFEEGGALRTREALFLPGRILLVVANDEDGGPGEDCECSGRFDKAHAVVDEFNYSTVVRTTEPAIRGYELRDEGMVTVAEIADLVPEDTAGFLARIPDRLHGSLIVKDILLGAVNRSGGLDATVIESAIAKSNARALKSGLALQDRVRARGRAILNADREIDWDDEPTVYQATSLAHGHLLQFKQEWIADGYSLGDVVHSLPLAPGQQKQIAVIDWESRVSARLDENRISTEAVDSTLDRMRDVNEVAAGVLKQNSRGGSSSRVWGVGGGIGIGAIIPPVGGLLGVAGGYSSSSASSWQNHTRRNTMSSAQNLRDRTVQSAAATRGQRATVVQTVRQGETFTATTETVSNWNHCHSLTIQYFEVLRHYRIETRLASVQECLFVPLLMKPFDRSKALRWREILEASILRRDLHDAFAAMARMAVDHAGSDLPEGTYADAPLHGLNGEVTIHFRLPTPTEILGTDSAKWMKTHLTAWSAYNPGLMAMVDDFQEADDRGRHALFERHVAPVIAGQIVDALSFRAVIADPEGTNERRVDLPLDATLVGEFRNDKPLTVSIRQTGALPPDLVRARIRAIEIEKSDLLGAVLSRPDKDDLFYLDLMPVGSSALVVRGTLRYRTDFASGTLFGPTRIRDDLLDRQAGARGMIPPPIYIPTPMSRSEMVDPRKEDARRDAELLDHLNDNLEFYHQLIWRGMDDARRFMFLDGIQVVDWSETTADRYPDGVVRSVASVVENEVIGVVGNSLVLPVAPGFRLDPGVRGKAIDLFSLYRPDTPFEPIRVSMPTSGVFAEAVMGHCNSCERIENDRFWKWHEVPIPNAPTAISEVSTASRAAPPPNLDPTEYPSPLVSIQNAPNVPEPSLGRATAELLGKSGVFPDAAGLDRTQQNAMSAYSKQLDTAKGFGDQAAGLTALGAKLDAIMQARKNNLMTADEAASATKDAFSQAQKASDVAIDTARAAAAGAATGGKGGSTPRALPGLTPEATRDLLAQTGRAKTAELSVRDDDGQFDLKLASAIDDPFRGMESDLSDDPLLSRFNPLAWSNPTEEDRVAAALDIFSRIYGATYADLDRRLALSVAYAVERDREWTTRPDDAAFAQAYADNRHPVSRARGRSESEAPAARLFETIREHAGVGMPAGMYTSVPTEDELDDMAPSERVAAVQAIMAEYGVDEPQAKRQPWSAVFLTACLRRLAAPEADRIDASDGFAPSGAHRTYFIRGFRNARRGLLDRPFWTSERSEVPISAGDLILKTRSGDLATFTRHGGYSGHWDEVSAQWAARLDAEAAGQTLPRLSAWARSLHSDLVVYVGPLAADTMSPPSGRFAVTLGGNTRDVRTRRANTVGMKIYRLDADDVIENEVERNLTDVVTIDTSFAVLHRPTPAQRAAQITALHPDLVERGARSHAIDRVIDEGRDLRYLDDGETPTDEPENEGDFPEDGGGGTILV
ncbi:hypothetical protein [Palleronia aestuarii]|uniref:hypothetical protein n=1 Tax=Palleronia aestuarii TaxID=568105 RepID=UPI0011B4791C|nr:hypothetical protein [Palleronia aestuarii]